MTERPRECHGRVEVVVVDVAVAMVVVVVVAVMVVAVAGRLGSRTTVLRRMPLWEMASIFILLLEMVTSMKPYMSSSPSALGRWNNSRRFTASSPVPSTFTALAGKVRCSSSICAWASRRPRCRPNPTAAAAQPVAPPVGPPAAPARLAAAAAAAGSAAARRSDAEEHRRWGAFDERSPRSPHWPWRTG